MRLWEGISVVFATAYILMSCDSDSLTRKHVPLWVGVSAADSLPKAERKHDFDKLKQLGLMQLILLVPLSKDKNGMPRLLPGVQQNLKRLATDADGFILSVQLYAEHSDSVFIAGQIDSRVWLQAYRKLLLEQVLPAVQGHSLTWLVFGKQFEPIEADMAGWKNVCDTLRMHTPAKLVYGTTADRISLIGFWPALDAIGVVHEPSPSGDYKAQARQEHKLISSVAQQYNKPLFIISTGLLGADKELKFKNALRFYNPSVAVQGICLNTLFASSVFTDSLSAFGVQLEPETVKYLWQYNAAH